MRGRGRSERCFELFQQALVGLAERGDLQPAVPFDGVRFAFLGIFPVERVRGTPASVVNPSHGSRR